MTSPNIALNALKLFLCVMRAGSLAQAAKESGLSPSAVSRQIASLETELGFRLFDRTTRRLSPTEAGRLYHHRIAPLIDAMEEARHIAADQVCSPSGTLKVTASVAFAERWLIPRLRGFQDAYPAVELDLALDDTPLDLVAEGVDIAIRLGARVRGDYIVSKLMATRYRVVASPDYVSRVGALARPEDLRERRCLCFAIQAYRTRWSFRKNGRRRSVDVPVRASLTISSALAVRRAALSGLGPALLADWTVADDVMQGRLIDLLPNWEASAEAFDTAAWILYPSRAYLPAKSRVFIDYMRACAQARPS